MRRLHLVSRPQCLITFDDVPQRRHVYVLVSPPAPGQSLGAVHHFDAVSASRHILQSQTCPVTRRSLHEAEISRLDRQLRAMSREGVSGADYGQRGLRGALAEALFLKERETNIQLSSLGVRNEGDVWMNTMLHIAADTHLPAWVRRDMIKSVCKQRYLDELGDLLRINVKEAARMVHEHRKLLTFQRVRHNMTYAMRSVGSTQVQMTPAMQQQLASRVQERENMVDAQSRMIDQTTDWKKCWPHRAFACASMPAQAAGGAAFETADVAAERRDAAEAMMYVLRSCEDVHSRTEDAVSKSHPESQNVLRATFDAVYAVIALCIQKIHNALSTTCMRHHSLFVKNVQQYLLHSEASCQRAATL